MDWRTIPSFPAYEVSESGDVRRSGRQLKPWIRDDGYRMYILRRDGKSWHRKAHQLVAETFIGPKPFPAAEVCHADGSRDNDHHTNLRWDTRSANHLDKRRHGTSLGGARHHMARLTPQQVAEIKRRFEAGELQRVIAAGYGVKQGQVSRIVRGKRWAT